LSDTTLFTVPGSWLRMLSSISCEDSPNEIGCQRQPAVDDAATAPCIASGLRSINFPAMPGGEQAGRL
jgi:hypothetical protein